ncbi:MAG: DUF134 domain-containing protein [bacterium]
MGIFPKHVTQLLGIVSKIRPNQLFVEILRQAEGGCLPRPRKQRSVSITPPFSVYKPAGVSMRGLERETITMDELEALKLAHMGGFYQVAIAKRMGVSRQTAARILESAHTKVTEALVMGKALFLEGGSVRHEPMDEALCPKCGTVNGCEHDDVVLRPRRHVHRA